MGRHTCCNKQNVKRGLWSPEEDEKLISYITAYGHGCWSTVPRLAGLQRCGKSCRLRWINYLRPDLKRGNFTPHEAALIIELHRILGNKWAQIAKHLPGRTDNEVKNFWNSSIKKKLLAHHKNPCDQKSNSIININPNNNLTQMDIQMIIDSQMEKIGIPPPVPPAIMMNYTSDPAAMAPPLPPLPQFPVATDPSFSDLPPPLSLPPPCNSDQNQNNVRTVKQEDIESTMLGLFDNNLFNLKPEMQAYEQDSAMLDALVPELSEMNKMIEFAPPLPPPPAAAVAMQGSQVLDPNTGLEACFGPALHPNHISNIASLMASFAPPPAPPHAALAPQPCNRSFRFGRYLRSTWGPQP